MAITQLTAITIGLNYPENIEVITYEEKSKFGFYCYLTKDAQVHTLLLSSKCIYKSEEEAKNVIHDLATVLKDKFHKHKNENI